MDADFASKKFSSGTETLVGSLWLLAVYFIWQYILVSWYNLDIVAEL